MAISFIPKNESNEDYSHWIPLADLMTGLMMVFLLISISFIVTSNKNINSVEQKLEAYNNLKLELHNELEKEFSDDLIRWGGRLESKTLIISFTDPNILFKAGESQVSSYFKEILNNFIPRYIKILNNSKYRKTISELRIEGHTSSEWYDQTSMQHLAYIRNMELSQDRTRNVLTYILTSTPTTETSKAWIREHTTATGLSSSRIIKSNGVENKSKSRRVEFRILTNSDSLIHEIQSTIDAGEGKNEAD